MHPRNPYSKPIEFSSLAEYFPPLKPLIHSVSGRSSIDFQNPDAQRALTQALLKRDFNITLSLPENRLCPAVPNRLNYVLWIQDILSPFGDSQSERIRGLDIGTGASAIYPLLACSFSPSTRDWEFVATEIDPLSASYAQQNVEINNLSSRIKIWRVLPPSPTATENIKCTPILVPLLEDAVSRYDFTMCNPPFYGSEAEIQSAAESKELPPNAVCTGAETEMITPGGETAFVLQMVRESAQEGVRGRCRWFSSMLGKLSSVGTVVEELHKLKISNYALTQFVQGTTRRWAVGWSFGDERLPDAISRPPSSSLSPYLPPPTTFRQSFSSSSERTKDPSRDHKSFGDVLRSTVSVVLRSIDGLVFRDLDSIGGNGEMWKLDIRAAENTWSRAARRKRKRKLSGSPPVSSPGEGGSTTGGHLLSSTPTTSAATTRHSPPLSNDATISSQAGLHCRVTGISALADQRQLRRDLGAAETVILEIQWVRGMDRSLFEGFSNHICRRIRDML